MSIKDYLTVRKIAKQLGLTEYRIRELIREKQIRATKIGQWRVKPGDLQEFIKVRTNK
jgi:excisionase family DNA binding protein